MSHSAQLSSDERCFYTTSKLITLLQNFSLFFLFFFQDVFQQICAVLTLHEFTNSSPKVKLTDCHVILVYETFVVTRLFCTRKEKRKWVTYIFLVIKIDNSHKSTQQVFDCF